MCKVVDDLGFISSSCGQNRDSGLSFNVCTVHLFGVLVQHMQHRAVLAPVCERVGVRVQV